MAAVMTLAGASPPVPYHGVTARVAMAKTIAGLE
jgi:hypothetical protein